MPTDLASTDTWCSSDEMMEQASQTAIAYHMEIEKYLDACYGAGYAKKNPALVGAMIQAASIDFAGGTISKVLDYLARDIADVGNALEKLTEDNEEY